MNHVLAIALLMLACIPAPVRAQEDEEYRGSHFDRWAAPVTVAEATALAREAGLDASGAEAARALVRACETTLRRAAARVERAVEKASINRKLELGWSPRPEDREFYTTLQQQETAKRRAAHDEAASTLLSDLRALLPAGKDDAWASFERRRRRRLLLYPSRLGEVGPDLIAVAEQARLADLPAVREVLAAYELDLDRLVVARHAFAKEGWGKIKAAQQRQDQAEAERLYATFRDAECALLRLQRAAAARLLDAVPKERREEVRLIVAGPRESHGIDSSIIRHRVERVLKSGQLDRTRQDALKAALTRFRDGSRAAAERYRTAYEESRCTGTLAELDNPSHDAWKPYSEEFGRLMAELQRTLYQIATEDELDAADGMSREEEAAAPLP